MENVERTQKQTAIFDAIRTGEYSTIKQIADEVGVTSAYVSKIVKKNPNVYKEHDIYKYKSITERALELILTESNFGLNVDTESKRRSYPQLITISISSHGVEEAICKYISDIFNPTVIAGYKSVLIHCTNEKEYNNIYNYLKGVETSIEG